MNLEPGEIVGRFTIVSFIGAGGMGQVYRARDPQLGRHVAIKILPTASAGKPEAVGRFRQEARALGLLNHPNLVTVFDFGTHGDSFYIVLELLEGQTLRERLRDGGAFTQRKAIHYAVQIARGMAEAHDRKVIHRDLKPENVFIARDGGLKILDFGLARMNPELNGAGIDADTLTLIGSTPGLIMGTIGYISPEQLRGEAVDYRADIFAFGAILYEMLTGQRAFQGSTAIETLTAVLRDDPADLQLNGIAVMPGLDLVVRRCLEKQPQDRFQSAHDLALALEALSSGSTDSMSVPFMANLRDRARRFQRVVGIAALIVTGAVAGALLWSRVEPAEPPSYRQLTFRRGDISAARFTPDGGVAYSASWDGDRYQIYSTRMDSVDARTLDIASRELLAVSATGDLALLTKPNDISGTLAVASLSGGAPREMVSDTVAADWSPDGKKLAVARRLANGNYQIEYPLNRIIYRSATRIRDLRVSPDGRSLAFRLREGRLGKLFAVVVIDVSGSSARKLGDWNNAKGLAWSPNGEIVFACSGGNGSTELRSLTLNGKSRLLNRFDGSVKLHDVSRDGNLLFTRDDYREGIMARAPGAEHERDLSWFDGSGASDISSDGRLILMSEFGEAGGPHYSAYVRLTSGEPAVRLGDGYGVSLSPDRNNALVITPGSSAHLSIVPLGAGATRVLDRGDVEDFEFGAWLPNGQTIVFNGRTAKGRMRIYRQDVLRGPPLPIGEPGMRLAQSSRPASPDGLRLAVVRDDGALLLLPIDGNPPATKLPLDDTYRPVAWSSNGRDLFVYREGELPARLFRLDTTTGELRLVWQLMPADPAGVYRVVDIVTTPDGSAYAYGVLRNLSTLFFSTGWGSRLR